MNFLFNLLFVVFSLFSFGMIIPFVEMIFDSSSIVVEPASFSFTKEALTQWAAWGIYSLKINFGILKAILIVSICYVSFSFLSNISRYFAFYFITPVRNGIVMRIRNDIYHRITILPISFFKKHKKGDILSRFSSDLSEIEWCIAVGIHNMIKEPITFIVYGVTLIYISPKLVLLSVVLAPLTFFFIKKIGKSLNKNATRAQKQIGEVMAVTEESLTGIKVIKAFGAEETIQRKFSEANGKYTRSLIKTFRRKELGSPLFEIISSITLVFIITYGDRKSTRLNSSH